MKDGGDHKVLHQSCKNLWELIRPDKYGRVRDPWKKSQKVVKITPELDQRPQDVRHFRTIDWPLRKVISMEWR